MGISGPKRNDSIFPTMPKSMRTKLQIRKAYPTDEQALWEILEPIIRKGGTYVFSTQRTKSEMMEYWLNLDKETYVAEENGLILGTCYIKPNQPDLGVHICNAGFMVSPTAWGKGIGRALGVFAIEEAKSQGYQAMQFNFVIKTNEVAVRLWKSLGFQIIGEIPSAYRHPELGEVSALILYKRL
jgi:ribosomal protein S18 acetylase RimI-like enzyme